MTNENRKPKRIAIFASGKGSNAQKIIDYFRGSGEIEVALIVSNKSDAGVLEIARKEAIPSLILDKHSFFQGDSYPDFLKEKEIDFIVLAGFLWKMPSSLIKSFPQRMVNIHPALLPKFGGKGMYGARVHEAVLAAKEKESGITIHYVDEIYDHGQIIFQTKCPVSPGDNPDSLAEKIHSLEYAWYPKTIEKLLQNIVKRS
ncbi:MAG: phosphoribosylglycinamide formyltransferase [Chitinophagales bacterium]